MSFLKNLIAATALIFACFVPNVAADTATDTVNVNASLMPAFRLWCSDVHFGVWLLPVRSDSEMTTIELQEATFQGDGLGITIAIIRGNRRNVAQSTAAAPRYGSCFFEGSDAAASTDMNIFIATTGEGRTDTRGALVAGKMVAAADGEYAGLNGPEADFVTPMRFGLGFPVTTPINENGAGSFKIMGSLSIPGTIGRENGGAYKADGVITITVDDGI